MSLLLEALKKAEKAKEEAQRRARDGDGAELQLSDAGAAAPAEPRHVVTRDELPQINAAPLEILSEDIRGEAARPAARELALQDARPSAAPPPPPRPGADPQAAQRAAARKVFEAKVREPNPRLPFLITMGALGAFAVGTVIFRSRSECAAIGLDAARTLLPSSGNTDRHSGMAPHSISLRVCQAPHPAFENAA